MKNFCDKKVLILNVFDNSNYVQWIFLTTVNFDNLLWIFYKFKIFLSLIHVYVGNRDTLQLLSFNCKDTTKK